MILTQNGLREFSYSSGMVSTGHSFWTDHGILEAKIKFNPRKEVVSAFYLLGEEASPQINLLEMGPLNRVGLLSRDAHHTHALTGLKKGNFYIFRLEWSRNLLVWKVNNHEVYRLATQVPDFPMHLNAASIVVDELRGSLSHSFEIDWVRFFQPKKQN